MEYNARWGTPVARNRLQDYLLFKELAAIALARPACLTLVFDQSYQRGQQIPQMKRKLAMLADEGLGSIAYISHACLLITSKDEDMLKRARELITIQAGLPNSRILSSSTGVY